MKIKSAMDSVYPSISSLKWFFSCKSKKLKAVESYAILEDLLVDQYGLMAKELLYQLDKINRIPGSEVWDDYINDPIAYISIIEDISPGLLGNDDSVYGLPEDLAREIQDESMFPEGLLCTLRRYQEWGVKYILHQEKVLLGDEMGLGKTIQAIATMVSLKNTGASHFVVVCPASVITNWCREITKHSLLKVTKVHGNGRKAALNSWMRTGGVAVTTYETTGHFKLDHLFKYSLLVVDEAHYIKNPNARRSINTLQLTRHADRLLFMTGTALENRVDEMITLIDMLQPKIVNQVRNIAFLSSASVFREKIAPVYYRRKREDVLTELPELIESKEWCTMTHQEEKAYEEAVITKRYSDARRVSWNLDDLSSSSKAGRLKEIIEEAEAENRKILVFSFFLDTIDKIALYLGNRCLNPITGSVNPDRRQEIIDEFEKASPGTVLVAQIQSGGTGLNIQAASVVVICEPQFKPSIENQAISRAYRMGQSRNVLVYRLLCENTLDEKITEMLEAKQAIFDAFADKSVAATKGIEVDEKSFSNIIKEEINRINSKQSGAVSMFETKQEKVKLNIELIPKTAWGSSLRQLLKPSDWGKIRKLAISDQNFICHTCGQRAKSLEAHEVWEFDEERQMQILVDIIGICKACHNTIHFGRAQKIGYGKQALEQYLLVNECDKTDLDIELAAAKSRFDRLSKIENWDLDISWIQKKLNFPLDDLKISARPNYDNRIL